MNNLYGETFLPGAANYVQRGIGAPVILIHGLAASLHDWDDLLPELADNGYAAYALDLLGHGDSQKPASRVYQVDWMHDHFSAWMISLNLTEPAVLIGHSLGAYVALEYARRFPSLTRGLILVNPFYARSQLHLLLRNAYNFPNASSYAMSRLPAWLFRILVDLSSVAFGHGVGALHSLPEKTRVQTALDYTRTASGVYHIPSLIPDMNEHLHEVNVPTLVVWGDQDKTLAPSSFAHLVSVLPEARGEVLGAGHVPHQSHTAAFNKLVLQFLEELAQDV